MKGSISFLEDFANFLFIERIDFAHKKDNTSSVHKSDTHFIQLFEIGTQSLVGLRSCRSGNGDAVGLSWGGNFFFTHLFNLQSGRVESLADGSAGESSSIIYLNKGGHAGEHDFVNAFDFLQSHTGSVGSTSSSTAKRDVESFNCGGFSGLGDSSGGEDHRS